MTAPGDAAGGTTAARRPPGKRRPAREPARTCGKRLGPLLPLAAGCGFVAGLGIGGELALSWVAAAEWGAVLAGIAACLWAVRAFARRRQDGLETGAETDTSARQAIEHALATPGCAVAHSVRRFARTGTIDHLVATPLRLWVIETRHDDVPPEQFPEVLRLVSEQTSTVWKWAPPGTPVRGCLVLAKGAMPGRRTCDYGHEPVVLHTPASLARGLGDEASKERMLDERAAADVWELGRVAEKQPLSMRLRPAPSPDPTWWNPHAGADRPPTLRHPRRSGIDAASLFTSPTTLPDEAHEHASRP